jgi:hypothetical protein
MLMKYNSDNGQVEQLSVTYRNAGLNTVPLKPFMIYLFIILSYTFRLRLALTDGLSPKDCSQNVF